MLELAVEMEGESRPNLPGEQRRKIQKHLHRFKRCLTFSDAWAPSAALALRSEGASLLELAVPCVIWKGIQVEEKK